MIDEMIERIANNAKEAIKAEDGDYVENGLLYCGKCKTPKQVKLKLNNYTRIVHCLCKCMQEQEEREEREFKERLKREEKERRLKIRQRKIESVQNTLSPGLKKCTFENDDKSNPRLTEIAQNYCKQFSDFKGKGLLFYGGVGGGKTFISACIVNYLKEKDYNCLSTNFSILSNKLQSTFDGKQELIDTLTDFDLVLIDDLDAERDTEYMNEIVQTVIDNLYRAKVPIIVTTNLTGEQLSNPINISKERTYSRILEMCIPVKVNAEDRRRKKAKQDYAKYNKMLGIG